jgi:hypothetical protein
VIGCSKGSVPDNQVHLNYASTACFKGMGQRFQDFFKGGGSATDMHTNWSCMTQVLNDFSRINETSVFPQDQLKSFINDHYDLGLTDATMQSVMKFKQVLVGGSLDAVTKAEINLLVLDLNSLDTISNALAPFTPILFGDANATSTDDQWNKAYMTFAGQLPKLAAMLSSQNLPYAFADLQTFAIALADQFGAANDSFIRKLGKLIPAVGSAKVILISGPNDQMLPKEWMPLLSSVGTSYLTFKSAMRTMDLHPNDVSLALNEPRLFGAVQNIVQILNSAVQARANKQISFNEIRNLLNQLNDGGMYSTSFTVDQAMFALNFLVVKIFPAPSAALDALDALHMAEMQKFAARWKTVLTAYTQGKASTIPDFAASIQADNWSLNLDDGGRLVVPPGTASVRLEFPAIYSIMEWFGQKWGPVPLNQDQFHVAVTDVLSLLHNFGWLASTKDDVYLRLIREANLFMPSSNGNMQLELNEAFQYAVFALSSYRSSHALILATNKTCGDNDFFCFQNSLFANRATLFSNLPNLNKWLGNDANLFAAYTKDVNTIVGTSELMEFMIVNYIETFMQRFDANRDGLITISEAETAFKVYGPVLVGMLAENNVPQSDVSPLYAWLFAYGKKPGNDLSDSLHWLWWKENFTSWSCSADRKTLASILAALIKM